MSYTEDRVYTFMNAALHGNPVAEKKYFFDPQDNTLFLLEHKERKYKIDKQFPQLRTPTVLDELKNKILKLLENNHNILELHRLSNVINIHHDTINKRTKEEFEELWNLGQRQFELTQQFMDENGIDPTEVRVIE